MHYCCVKLCGKNTKTSGVQKDGISFHRFPKCLNMKEIWINATKRSDNWFPSPSSVVCSRHFKSEYLKLTKAHRILYPNAVPTLHLPTVVSEQDAQPGKSKILDTRTPLDSAGREQDPLSRVIEQCRFCGEFSKDCVAVSGDMTYLAGNQTALALNDTRVQLDFNDRSLPNAVCRDCDAKLQEFCDFVKVVKAAQCTLINVTDEKAEFEEPTADFEENPTDFEESTAEYEEIEILVVKTEASDDEGIMDPLAVGKTVVVNETHKRKSDADTTKPKKLKTKEKCDDDLGIAIKEEVVEKGTNEQSEVSDTGTNVEPSELELARSALVFKMAGDGTSKYQ